jgi:hypothetical protein
MAYRRFKVMALGALLAAIEMDLTVAYVEAVDYQVRDIAAFKNSAHDAIPVHLWLKHADLSHKPEPSA